MQTSAEEIALCLTELYVRLKNGYISSGTSNVDNHKLMNMVFDAYELYLKNAKRLEIPKAMPGDLD